MPVRAIRLITYIKPGGWNKMEKHDTYDAKFAKQMSASTAVSNGLEVLAGVVPEGAYFMHNGVAYPLHGITAEKEHLPISGKTVTVAEFPNSQVPILSALTGAYVDFPVEESQSGVNAGAIAMGLAAIVAGGAALALSPGHAYAADSATGTVSLGYVLDNLNALPDNPSTPDHSGISGNNGKAYLIDFRPNPDMTATNASKVMPYNEETKTILNAVFGDDFEKRVDGEMENTELGKAQLKLKRFNGDYLLITLTPQYNRDPSQPVRTTQCDKENKDNCVVVEENKGYELPETRGTEIVCEMDFANNVCDVVDSLKINGKEKEKVQKTDAAGIINLLGDYFQNFEVIETKYTEQSAGKKSDEGKGTGLTGKASEDPTIESKLKITIADKGGHPLVDTDKDGKLDTRLGNPYSIALEYSGASEGSQTAKVTVEYTPLKIVPKGATAPVSVATAFEEKNIESALTSALSSMTPSATSTIATDTVQTNFATSTAFPNLGVYTIAAEVGGATSTVDVYFPAFAGNNNNGSIIAALLGIGVIAAVLKDKGGYDIPAAPAEIKPTEDPDTQLLGGEQTHTIKVK